MSDIWCIVGLVGLLVILQVIFYFCLIMWGDKSENIDNKKMLKGYLMILKPILGWGALFFVIGVSVFFMSVEVFVGKSL